MKDGSDFEVMKAATYFGEYIQTRFDENLRDRLQPVAEKRFSNSAILSGCLEFNENIVSKLSSFVDQCIDAAEANDPAIRSGLKLFQDNLRRHIAALKESQRHAYPAFVCPACHDHAEAGGYIQMHVSTIPDPNDPWSSVTIRNTCPSCGECVPLHLCLRPDSRPDDLEAASAEWDAVFKRDPQ